MFYTILFQLAEKKMVKKTKSSEGDRIMQKFEQRSKKENEKVAAVSTTIDLSSEGSSTIAAGSLECLVRTIGIYKQCQSNNYLYLPFNSNYLISAGDGEGEGGASNYPGH